MTPYNKAVAKKKPPYKFPPNPAVKLASVAVGSQTELAKELGVPAPVVTEWIKGKREVPAQRCVQIEQITKGEVTRKHLRADWKKFWPELATAAEVD